MAYTNPQDPYNPQASGGTNPLFPPAQNPAQVIEPDDPVKKPGSWDDILPQQDEPLADPARSSIVGQGNPADNQPLPAKLHDLSTTLREREVNEADSAAKPERATNIFEPATAQNEEPHSMFDVLDQPQPPQPEVANKASATEVEEQKTENRIEEATTPQISNMPYQLSVTNPASDAFEQELEDTFAAKFARYGKTAVNALALPFVSSGRLTKSILRNGLRTTTNVAQPAVPDFSQPSEPARIKKPVYTPPTPVQKIEPDTSAISHVSRMYGISRHEALQKIRQAVNLANQQAGHEVARILEHDPNIETDDEVGVYIDVEGGRALSLNSEDVMRVLGNYL